LRVDGVVTDQGVDAGRGVPERAHLLRDGGFNFLMNSICVSRVFILRADHFTNPVARK